MHDTLIWVICGLLAILIAGGLIFIKQHRELKEARGSADTCNRKLQEATVANQSAVAELEKCRRDLKSTQNTLGHYAELFMEFSAVHRISIEKYHMALTALALQGNLKGIIKRLDSGDISAGTLRVFYAKFDEAILNIFPWFIDRINTLLLPGSLITLKGNEKLNTELRIMALIRIGITDSEKMAQFLFCSLSTIYTYRSKMKRRAINPEEFESQIAEL